MAYLVFVVFRLWKMMVIQKMKFNNSLFLQRVTHFI